MTGMLTRRGIGIGKPKMKIVETEPWLKDPVKGASFRKEKDLRNWVKSRTDAPFWIEPTRGSTIGVPDAFVHDAGGVWIELKVGVCKDRRLLKWKTRAGQYRALKTIRDRGLRGGLVVGFGNRIYVTSDPEVARANWAEVRAEKEIYANDPEAWAKILEKIVNDCK